MATPQLSPGILVREVDLTKGRVDNVVDTMGAIAGPFAIGPVNTPVRIDNEQQLIDVFGKPASKDDQYQYWMSAASYLSYGGSLTVVRSGSSNHNNANATTAVGVAATNLSIDSFEDYSLNYDDTTTYVAAAKNPGTWGDGLQVCMIDNFADQTLTIETSNASAGGYEVGHGIKTGINTSIIVGSAVTTFVGDVEGIITGISTTGSESYLAVKVLRRKSSGGVMTPVEYQEGSRGAAFVDGDELTPLDNVGAATTVTPLNTSSVADWYASQKVGGEGSSLYWSEIAPRPVTNNYVALRGGANDAMHVVVIDAAGKVSGIKGNLLEKHISLSKATDTVSEVNSPLKTYFKDYVSEFSDNIFIGAADDSLQVDSFLNEYAPSGSGWGEVANENTFKVSGNLSYTLSGGADYGASGGMMATLGDIQTAYSKFSNADEVPLDFLIMGPSCSDRAETQAKANYVIALAEARKDCVAVIGPHKGDLVGVTNSETQTQNLLDYFSPLSSSSYAVFDSGYKYTFDRFNNKFRYIPCNPDVAGMMCRTGIEAHPWFSPAGTSRGVINNAIKLAYNPSKSQRDRLYPNRINAFITAPGQGTFLFGDKTALAYASAFDRINVRRLFLTIEQALQSAANAQLFELNDDLTRANFRNIVEPYLRDVQAKRGLFGFLVVCDESNNTPDVIDNNEFRADIYLQPTKSINYVTLTFVATRTGVSFNEVAGRV